MTDNIIDIKARAEAKAEKLAQEHTFDVTTKDGKRYTATGHMTINGMFIGVVDSDSNPRLVINYDNFDTMERREGTVQ